MRPECIRDLSSTSNKIYCCAFYNNNFSLYKSTIYLLNLLFKVERMKVSGFSFIKNAVKYQYPIAEALQSILPLCDEVIVAVGNSEDNTRELVASVNAQKIKIIDTVWDESLKEGGRVLASETDKAFHTIGEDTDWCIYIQGDEVLHEQYYDEVLQAMHRWKDDKNVDGLLFNYKHFY